MKISLKVEGIPVAKGRPRFRRYGKFVGTYTPAKTLAAEKKLLSNVNKYKPSTPISEPIHLDITFFMPIPKSTSKRKAELLCKEQKPHIKRPDLDNLVKLVKDALNGIFWNDDSQIFSMNVSKKYSDCPSTEITISTITDTSEQQKS